MTKRKDIHWYCGSCEPKVLQCIKLEKEIERKLVDFMGKVDYKIKTLEEVFTKRQQRWKRRLVKDFETT